MEGNETMSASHILRLIHNKNKHYCGGRELDRFRGIPSDTDDSRPEAWVGSVTRVLGEDGEAGLARAHAPGGGTPLVRDLIASDPEGYLGARHIARWGNEPALLVKLLDAGAPLTLQCHPTRELARALFASEYGKEESWYVLSVRLDAPEPPHIVLGFREDVSREAFAACYRRGDIAGLLAMCHTIPVSSGEMYIVPPGVPHAIGGGCLLVETQEPCDITVFAVRERNADPEAALRCFDYTGRTAADNAARFRVPPRTLRREPGGGETLLLGPGHTDRFSVTRLAVSGTLPHRATGALGIAIVTGGTGSVRWDRGCLSLRRGDELLIPARVHEAEWVSDGMEVVLCHPPSAVHTFIA
jgi:mannose-6-phosphate isomerase